MAYIELNRFSYWAPETETQLLYDLDFEIEAGEFVIVLGPSGAGKSTLALCLTGIYPTVLGGRTAGHGRVVGLDVSQTTVPQLSTHIGLIFQDPDSQFCNLFVDEEVAFGPENLRLPREEVGARASAALRQVGLEGFQRRMINTLSGGQKQRVAIASVLAMGPEVLVLDQPTANLDPVGKNEIYDLLYRLNREQGKTIVLIEHQVDELIQFASRLLLMGGGRLLANGAPREVLAAWGRRMEKEMGLWLPEVARLAFLAQDAGFPMAAFPLSADEVALAWPTLPAPMSAALATARPPKRGHAGPFLLQGDHVTYCYADGFEAVRDVSFNVNTGDLVGLMGENGSGKTTLSLHFVGLLRPKGGRLLLGGESIASRGVKSLAADVGYVFQYPEHQFVADTVADEVAYTPRLEGKQGEALSRLVQSTLAEVGLQGLENRHPYTLSMGEKRRLSIATMLVRRPKLLILDEPSAGLDFRNTERIMTLLLALREQGTTIMLVTHTTYLVARYASQVLVMDHSELVFDGLPQDLFINLGRIRTKAIDRPEMLKVVEALRARQGVVLPPYLTVDELALSLNSQERS
ncbi:MAG: ABC transporter ATP-binding protein [Anaerolineales bacterium]|nr:ABC transporter ATP-binding protein [Anaerolineales bacterium]